MSEKPYRVEHLRLDISYFPNHVEFSFMKPDRRKIQQRRNLSRLIKWEWAIASGVCSLSSAAASIAGALQSSIKYRLRAMEHDLNRSGTDRSVWFKKGGAK